MKENKIEKLILDLSNRWECTPQEAVDRLNSMDESEINKLIKSMIKKFQYGGKESGRKLGNPSDFEYKSQSTAVPASIVGAPKVYGEIKDYRFVNDTIPNGDIRNRYAKSIIQQYFMPHGTSDSKYEDTWPMLAIGRTEYKNGNTTSEEFYTKPDYIDYVGPMSLGRENQDAAKQRWYQLLSVAAANGDQEAQKVKASEDAKRARVVANEVLEEAVRNEDAQFALLARQHAAAMGPRVVAPVVPYGVTLHKNGGIMKCLQGGKTYAECKKCGGKTPVVKNQEPAGPILPKYAKIIEGGGRNAEPRRIYYSDDKNNFEIEDGRLMSHEEVANPWGYWNNEAIKAGSQFGLKLPQVPVQYGPPVYSRYVQHPEVLNLQPADDIDHDKAAIETSEKIRKIRRK